MASRKRKRKKSNKRWVPPTNYTLWLWAIFVVHAIVGLALSPVTSLTLLRVVGAPQFDQSRIRQAVQSVNGTPRLRANSNQIRSLILEKSAVEAVDYRANLFGRGVLTVRYKVPVAIIDEPNGLMLSSKGQLFSSPIATKNLPVLVPPAELDARNLTIVGGWRTREAAKICEKVITELPPYNWRIGVSKNGFVTLHPGAGAKVELGSFDDSEAKIRALAKILKDDPTLLTKVSKLTLYSPDKPVYEP